MPILVQRLRSPTGRDIELEAADNIEQLEHELRIQKSLLDGNAKKFKSDAERIEQLERENAELKAEVKRVGQICDLHALDEKLLAENAELRKDAERYQWLRDQNANLDAGFYVGDETDAQPEDITWVGSDLDAVVDAAMKELP